MPRFAHLSSSLLLVILAACSGAETPHAATPIQPQPAHTDFGALRVHYNLLPTLAMNDAVARSYQVEREADRALLVVALRRLVDGEEVPADGNVIAIATDLSGKQQQVTLRAVHTGAYTDLIGLLDAHPRDQLRINLDVSADAGRGSVRFERNF